MIAPLNDIGLAGRAGPGPPGGPPGGGGGPPGGPLGGGGGPPGGPPDGGGALMGVDGADTIGDAPPPLVFKAATSLFILLILDSRVEIF